MERGYREEEEEVTRVYEWGSERNSQVLRENKVIYTDVMLLNLLWDHIRITLITCGLCVYSSVLKQNVYTNSSLWSSQT